MIYLLIIVAAILAAFGIVLRMEHALRMHDDERRA
jgi:hypothetical protein